MNLNSKISHYKRKYLVYKLYLYLYLLSLKPKRLLHYIVHNIPILDNIALELNTSLAKLAVAWCIQNENVSTAILGASKVVQLKETLSSIDLLPKMTAEVNHSIEKILQNKPKETKY